MRKKINLALITIGIVITGALIVTGITRNKTEVNNSQPSTSISEQVEQTPETATSAESNIEIIEDETSISDDGLTSSNAGGSSEPVEVEITDDGVVTDKPEPYPDEYSLITQPEDSENSADSAESNETVIKDVGPTVDIENDPLNEGEDNILTADDLPSGQMSKEDFIKMVQESGTTLH